ncbi:MAG: hypothetical protein PVI33_04130, partial [Candidatus Omnitrophota bacterium]
FSWTIPDAISAQVKVKVSDYEDSDSFAISQANFKIRGGITINSPDGGEVWIVGAQHNITWSIVGSIAQVRLEYSTDGGWAYPYIIATAVDANLGIYAWVVPDTLSRECRVKITDVLDPTVYDTSDNNFQIQGDLILVSPNGQEEWEVGSTQNITWIRRGSIQKINIEYSTDGGLTFPHKIIESLDVSTEAGSYAWVVADAISEQVRVRISDSSDAAVYDVSDADFKIKGALAISSPNAGEVWQVGSSKDIAWELTGSIGIVKLEYSTNGGLSYPHIISPSIDAALETYSWIIPDSISHQARVRITDFSDASVYDTSDNDFKIIGRLILTSPNGGEVWPVGSSQAITWNKSGSIDKVKLEYSTDGGLSFPHLIIDSISSSLGSYNWVIPDVISQTIRVKITNVNDSVVYDTSDNNFKIRGGLILNAPNGGEDWVVGSLHNITWIRFGSIADVRLDYSVDAGKSYPYTIASSVDAAGEKYNWTIPDNPGFLTRVKISDASDITVYDTSDDNFIIRTGFTLTVPNGNEAWIVGSTHDIIWDRIGPVENVKLEYSSNGGLTFVPIVSSTSNTGFYSWVIPDTITTQALVRISDVDDSTISDTSDYFFKIQGGFILTSPNGNEVWLVGDRQEITWNCTGDIKFVKLEYSTDSGLTYSLIEDNLTNDGKYSWQIPDSVAGNMLVRVSDTNDPEAFDISDADFRIRCAFTLINPNGGEVWKVGRKYNISWVNIGNIPSVKLEYSRDNFVADVKTIASDAPSYKPYSWTIPDAIFDSVKVRVSDPNDPGAFDDSDTDFRIIGDFTIITPNGGEVWQAGQIKEITWLWKGSIPQVKIEYSTDGGATFSIISATDNTGTYTWRVPDEISDEFVVRISDLVDPGVYDDSDTYAQISAGL